MKAKKETREFFGDLRRRAAVRALPFRDDLAAGRDVPPKTRRLVQELQMHHIELELQNEDLERSRAEVEEGLARYADLYDLAPVGYLTLNRDGVIGQANLAGARLLGMERSRSSLVGMRLAFLVSTECRRDFADFLARTFESPSKKACEVLVCTGEGVRTVEFVAIAFEDGQRCRVIATDISERRRGEETLSIHLRLREFAVEHSRKEILQMALDEIERMTGGSSGNCYSLDADRRGFARETWSTSASGQFLEIEDVSRRYSVDETGIWKDCVYRRNPVVSNSYSIPANNRGLPQRHMRMARELVAPVSRNGNTVAIMGVANKSTDFTEGDVKAAWYLADLAWEIAERKKAEEERKKAEEECEKAKEERNKAEEEREAMRLQLLLAESCKMEAIDTLAGGSAHELNNIFSGVMGTLSWLDIEQVQEVARLKRHECIRDMMRLVTRGADLTKQLLGFASRERYDVMPLDLASIVANTGAMFGRTQKGITVKTDCAPDLWAVVMERTKIEQVLLNFLINAEQAMPNGGHLFLRTENADVSSPELAPPSVRPGRFVKLIVKDTGGGMDSAAQARIFEPFFTTREPGQGNSPGLAWVYGVIRSHSGFVTVASALGTGTTFTIHLPAVDPIPADSHRVPGGKPAPSLVDLSDEVLVSYVRIRDVAAFEELLSRYEDKLYRLAMRYVRNETDAKEVMQDALLLAWKNLPAFEGRAQFSSWMYRVTVNSALMFLRSRNRHPEIMLDHVEPSALNEAAEYSVGSTVADWSKQPDHRLQSKELRHHIQKAVGALPDSLRAVFLLRDVDGLSTEETAELLRLSVAAVKTRLHRSRLALREAIGRHFSS